MSEQQSYIEHGPGGTAFVGREAVNIYAAIVLKSGIGLYAKCGIRPNRHYTPTRMLAAAGAITGKKYKRGQYAQAVADLQEWIDTNRPKVPEGVRE